HEKKKMYWEQLELRCRSFYQQQSGPSSNHGSIRGPPIPPTTYCSCCEECRYPSAPAGPQVYPWDNHHPTDRWTSPNPENHSRARAVSGWSWRRLPWSRGNAGQTEPQRDNSLTYQGGVSSADSQYGFSNRSGGENALQGDAMTGSTGSYSILDNRPPVGGVYVWGPPPPYSNPNSPARRPMQSPGRYHHIHHHMHGHESHCQMNENNQFRSSRRTRAHLSNKDNYENTTEPEIHQPNDNSESTDTSSCVDRVSHTLPVRKMKKRTDIASVKSSAQSSNNRTNVQNIFNPNAQEEAKPDSEHDYHEPSVPENSKSNLDGQKCRFLPRLQGVENAAFQQQENSPQKPEATESEVYFADVSSCCNISVRNDGQDSSLYDEALETQKPRLLSLQKSEVMDVNSVNTNQLLQNFQENISSSTVTEDEDYLAHRMGNRQMSTRSRMPFPLPCSNELSDFTTESCMQLLPKDISQNSLCSSVQTPLTETTDDAISPDECCGNYFQDKTEQSTKHRGFTNSTLDHYLAPDAQYEVIPEQDNFRQNSSNLTNTISGLNNFEQNYYNQNKSNFNYNTSCSKNIPPKTLNLNQQARRNIGTNISALIQNLGGNPAGLLYGENIEDEIQGQGCHSDGTMDSGWQSGSEKTDRKQETSDTTHKPVNV
ncbi:hypothetical protein NQ314_018558, partial [Rhamnusium bicolor]